MHVQLSDSELLGAGATRVCYAHPEDRSKCVKVIKSGTLEPDINEREYRYYKLLYKRKVSFEHIPNCFGFIESNKGKGLVFELVGRIGGDDFEQSLKLKLFSLEKALQMFDELQAYLMKYSITFIDTGLSNLIVSDNKLKVVDGLIPPKSPRSFIYRHVKPLSRWRTKKSMAIARRNIIAHFQQQ